MVCDNAHLSFIDQPKDVDSGAQAYCKKMHDEQRSIRNHEEDLAVLCAALAKFPKLRNLIVTNYCEAPTRACKKPVRGSRFRDSEALKRTW